MGAEALSEGGKGVEVVWRQGGGKVGGSNVIVVEGRREGEEKCGVRRGGGA